MPLYFHPPPRRLRFAHFRNHPQISSRKHCLRLMEFAAFILVRLVGAGHFNRMLRVKRGQWFLGHRRDDTTIPPTISRNASA